MATQPATVVAAQPAAGEAVSSRRRPAHTRSPAHCDADERAHLRANDQLGADGIAGHLRADGRAHTGSDRVADIGAISVADTGADEGAHHRPHRWDAVKCTYTRSEPAQCT